MNNLRTPPLSSCKNLPPYFFMVHLLHRLYGVDAPDSISSLLHFSRLLGPVAQFRLYLYASACTGRKILMHDYAIAQDEMTSSVAHVAFYSFSHDRQHDQTRLFRSVTSRQPVREQTS